MARLAEHGLELAWRRPRLAGRALAVPRRELAAYAGVFLTALTLRVVDLSNRPLHSDESAHAWFSWLLFSGEGYEYDPVFHGPVQFYAGATMYALAGVGDVAIRLGPALAGSAITLLPLFLRRHLGAAAAVAAAVLLCIGPSFLYYSRFAREDVYAATITLGLVVLTFRFLDSPRRWHPAAILALLAAGFATKETTYITVFVGGTFLLAAAGWEVVRARRRGRAARTARIVAAVRSVGGEGWAWGLAAFAFVYTVLFTTFLLEPEGLRTGIYDSVAYWLSQQEVNRGSQPWFYYLVVLPLYELPVLLLAMVGVVAALRRPTLFRLFLVWFAVLSLAVYSWASERMPWLALHPLLPLILLAGLGFQTAWAASRRLVARAAVAGAALLGAAFLLYGGAQVTYAHPADPAELLVFTTTSEQLAPVRDRLLALDRRLQAEEGRRARIVLDSWEGTGWPWGWYFRDLPVLYLDLSRGGAVAGADAVIVSEVNDHAVQPALRGYRRSRFHLRQWWVVDYGAISPESLWKWFSERRPWGPRGYLDEVLYVRAGVAARSGR